MPQPPRATEDPVVTSSRREALLVLAVWAIAAAYSLTYCGLYGYSGDVESLRFVLWFPDWVFWGIVAPWLACVVFSLWFALVFMRDEDLGPETSDEDDLAGGAP